jgi:hypothetical protein
MRFLKRILMSLIDPIDVEIRDAEDGGEAGSDLVDIHILHQFLHSLRTST